MTEYHVVFVCGSNEYQVMEEFTIAVNALLPNFSPHGDLSVSVWQEQKWNEDDQKETVTMFSYRQVMVRR